MEPKDRAARLPQLSGLPVVTDGGLETDLIYHHDVDLPEFASQLNQDAVDGRVWSGIHFRTADVVGNQTGTQVGDWALDNYFQPTHRR